MVMVLVVVLAVVVVGHPALHLGLHLTGLDFPPGKQVEAASVLLLCADGDGVGGGGGGDVGDDGSGSTD